ENFLREVIEGPGIGSGSIQTNRLAWPLGAHLVPSGDRAPGLPDPPEIVGSEALDELVPRIDHDRESIPCDLQFDELHAIGAACFHLSGQNRPRSVVQIRLAATETSESS